MLSHWRAFKEAPLIFILCMDWENFHRFALITGFRNHYETFLVSENSDTKHFQGFARLSAVHGGTYMLNKPECKVKPAIN